VACTLCPGNVTTRGLGAAACTVPVEVKPDIVDYAVRIDFVVNFIGNLSLAEFDAGSIAGVAASSDLVLTNFVRQDTAQVFNISIADVAVNEMHFTDVEDNVGRRVLISVNVTTFVKAHVEPDATQEEIETALGVAELNADTGVKLLSDDPDSFFESTTSTLQVSATTNEPPKQTTLQPEPPASTEMFWEALPFPWELGLGVLGGVVLTFVCTKQLRRLYRRRKLYRQMYAPRSAGGGKSMFEMRALNQAALTKLSKFKSNRSKSALDKMWERRV